ncbi:MOSC domain-containing protein [Polymorphospora rubra]|uniref:Molybdenum cofactor biosysynthesis protein n=1 Tax=Polymorphospora rubra TaxID=338584 RepID=A0A810MWE9_9ACTN|nr:MOSC domain-containing protein [Polymorphospora rubra]BCJ63953.1 molybdenum cofactor biosysynthesis protein [Polymorphospora rubra]
MTLFYGGGQLVALHRYPLKSAAAETLSSVDVSWSGLAGDRVWACVDADDVLVSAKKPRRFGRLLDVTAEERGLGGLTVTMPGTAPASTTDGTANAALSTWLGTAVRLTRTAPAGTRVHRWWPDEPGLVPEWMTDAEPGTDTTTPVGVEPGGRFFDFGAIHLVTTGALAALAEQHGGPVAAGRFRPNLVLALDDDPEPGQRLRIGADLVLSVTMPTPRCVVPSLAQPGGGPADPGLLRTLARHHRMPVATYGRATCFGRYASVVEPGTVRVGDPVRA